MKKLLAAVMAGSLSLAAMPPAFAQSVSSSSMSSSLSSMSSSSSSRSSLSSSNSSSSAPTYVRSSRSYSSATSSVIRGGRGRAMSSLSSKMSSRSSVRSQRTTPALNNRNAYDIPEECRDLMGRAQALCVSRLSQARPTARSSSSHSTSSASSMMSGTGSMTNLNLWQLLMGKANVTDTQGMRTLCILIMNDNSSSCMQGSNLRMFNQRLQSWFMNLGGTLGTFMKNANKGGTDLSPTYFWNSSTFPFSGTGSSVKGWDDWMSTGTGSKSSTWNLWDFTSSSSSTSSLGRGQEGAWAACEGREARGKVRCVRDYLEQQNLEASGASSSSSLHTNSY